MGITCEPDTNTEIPVFRRQIVCPEIGDYQVALFEFYNLFVFSKTSPVIVDVFIVDAYLAFETAAPDRLDLIIFPEGEVSSEALRASEGYTKITARKNTKQAAGITALFLKISFIRIIYLRVYPIVLFSVQ
jgi:hypothetical protein